MSSHADTIRAAFLFPRDRFENARLGEAQVALDALLAENQRLREALDAAWATLESISQNGSLEADRITARSGFDRSEALAGDAE